MILLLYFQLSFVTAFEFSILEHSSSIDFYYEKDKGNLKLICDDKLLIPGCCNKISANIIIYSENTVTFQYKSTDNGFSINDIYQIYYNDTKIIIEHKNKFMWLNSARSGNIIKVFMSDTNISISNIVIIAAILNKMYLDNLDICKQDEYIFCIKILFGLLCGLFFITLTMIVILILYRKHAQTNHEISLSKLIKRNEEINNENTTSNHNIRNNQFEMKSLPTTRENDGIELFNQNLKSNIENINKNHKSFQSSPNLSHTNSRNSNISLSELFIKTNKKDDMFFISEGKILDGELYGNPSGKSSGNSSAISSKRTSIVINEDLENTKPPLSNENNDQT
jgi:hypothetical protein